MKLRDANLKVYEKSSFKHPLSSIVFIFSEYNTITSSEEAWKVCEHNFFQEIQEANSVTCNLPV